ncbi:MAG TPA: phosphoglycerate kinase [Candidatus Nanoarchaeia archaeon]|nr:phosphoglycerate kinase [Candidatus Nanoarchaeia archaeon]
MFLSKLSKKELQNKKVLVRLDLNSPVSKGKVEDSPRFQEASKTINFLIKNKSKIVIIAHQGRQGDSDFTELKEHAKILSKYTKQKVKYVDSLFEEQAQEEINKMKPSQVLLLKNVRHYDDEKNTKNPGNLYKNFSKNFSLFINEAFSVSHRDAASITLPPQIIPSYLGLAFEAELNILSKFNIQDKTCYIIAGMKIPDYLQLFENIPENRKIIVGGVLANLFLIAKGHDLGLENKWIAENGFSQLVPKLKEIYNKYPNNIVLPIDLACDVKKKRQNFALREFPLNYKIYDLGDETIKLLEKELKDKKSVFMKGPIGFTENRQFEKATIQVLKAISKGDKNTLIGGGHLTTTIKRAKLNGKFTHISTSGGALITYLAGKPLPGLEAVKNSVR